jgi:hypothetical protein
MTTAIVPTNYQGDAMAGYGKKGGFTGNLVKLGGKSSKLKLAGDMRPENLKGSASFKKASKQPHKRA